MQRAHFFKSPAMQAVIYMALGAGAGVLASVLYLQAPAFGQIDCAKQFPLVKATLDCGLYEQKAETLRSVDSAVDQAVDLYIKEGKADHISVWTRDLATLQWASTNENDRFAPGSLLKVPLMIAYYKIAELEPSLLSTELTYQLSPEVDIAPEFPPKNLLIPGQKYTVETLIEHMIIYSDNNAADVLASNIDPNLLNKVFIDLGIKIPNPEGSMTFDFITTKTYSSTFRNLYNASYLNEEYSEKALEILASTTFKGFASSLPKGVKIADKFGERGINNGNGKTRQLHECGIIYKPGNPYLLCVMTSGNNTDGLLTVIKNISALVYDRM
jgi:hypothetical protein